LYWARFTKNICKCAGCGTQKKSAHAGFIIIRSESAVADIPRDSAPLLCNPCCVWGREKPQKDIFVSLLPYMQEQLSQWIILSRIIRDSSRTFRIRCRPWWALHYISIGNIIIYYLSRPGLNFTASYDDFRMWTRSRKIYTPIPLHR